LAPRQAAYAYSVISNQAATAIVTAMDKLWVGADGTATPAHRGSVGGVGGGGTPQHSGGVAAGLDVAAEQQQQQARLHAALESGDSEDVFVQASGRIARFYCKLGGGVLHLQQPWQNSKFLDYLLTAVLLRCWFACLLACWAIWWACFWATIATRSSGVGLSRLRSSGAGLLCKRWRPKRPPEMPLPRQALA
jgi:hypothetical protein